LNADLLFLWREKYEEIGALVLGCGYLAAADALRLRGITLVSEYTWSFL